MRFSRRDFLSEVSLIAIFSGTGLQGVAWASPGQQVPGQPSPRPGMPQDIQDAPEIKTDPKTILKSDNDRMKKDVEKLYALASDLKDQMEKTNSANELSVNLIHKAEEIEKLAKQIQKLAAGE